MRIFKFLSFLNIALIAIALTRSDAFCYSLNESAIIETDKYILYIPNSLDKANKYPLIIGFSPVGDAQGIVAFWRDIADKHHLVVVASKEFRNNIGPHNAFVTMATFIEQSSLKYPIDSKKVITCGVSGGGMAAHMFSASYPKLTWAVISNCGRIHPDYITKEYATYPRNKRAVFLAGKQDYNYVHMLGDKKFLDRLGWETEWIEFQGGHSIAPKSNYEEAIEWLEEQMGNEEAIEWLEEQMGKTVSELTNSLYTHGVTH